VNRLLNNNTEVSGATWSVLATAPGGLPAAAEQLGRMVDDGELRPLVSTTYPLSEGVAALVAIDERKVTGKGVLIP